MSQNNGPISRLVNQSINSVVKPKKAAPPRMAPTAADYLLGRAQVPQPPAQAPNPIANQQRQNAQAVRRMSPGIDRVANPSNERRVQIRANTPGTPENTRELVRRQVAAFPIDGEMRAEVEALVDSALFIRTTYLDPETGMRRRVSPLASQNAIRQTGLLDPSDAMEVVALAKTPEGRLLLKTEVEQFRAQRGRGQAQAKELEALARPGNVDPNIAGIGAVIDAATMSPIGRAVSDVIQNDPANIAGALGAGEAVAGAFQDAGLAPFRAAVQPLRMLGVDPDAIERGIRQFGQAQVRGFAGGVSSMTRIPQLLGSKEWADLSDAIDKGIAMRDADKPLDKTFFNEIGRTIGGVVPQIAPALITGGSSIGASVAGRMVASAVFGMTEAATNAAGGFDRAVKEGQSIEEARQRAFRAMPVDAIVSSVLNKLGAFGELSPAWKKMFASSFTEGLQETFQTGLEGYVATGELDFTSPEAIKGGLLGMILGPLMGGGIDLATGTQMEGGAEAVPQRSAAASVPPASESYQAREKEYQSWEARLQELEALLERASGDTMLPNGMPNPMSKTAIQRMISEHRKSRPAFFVIGGSQPSAKPQPRTEPTQMPSREQIAAMNVGAEGGQVPNVNALRPLQSEIDEWAAYRRNLGLESDSVQQVAQMPAQSAQPVTTPVQSTKAQDVDATVETNLQDPQARAKAISESPIPGATEAAWSSGNQQIVTGVERIQDAISRVGTSPSPKEKDVVRLLTTMHNVRARAEAAGVDIDPAGELQSIEAQMRDLGYELDPGFMAAGSVYTTNHKADVLDHIQADGELRVHEQIVPSVWKNGRLIASPKIITIGYSEYWKSPEDDGGNAAQLPPPPDSTLPPTATAPAGMPQPAQAQQETQAPTQPVAQEAAQKEPWQMTRVEFEAKGGSAQAWPTRHHPRNIRLSFPDGSYNDFPTGVSGFDLEKARAGYHFEQVKKASQQGLPVPPEVLADYPDLAAKYQPQPAPKAAQPQESARPQPANVPDVPSLRKVAEGVGQEATKKANADLRRKVQSIGEPSQQDVNALQREYASKGYSITRNDKGQYIITKTKGGLNSSTPGQARFGLLRMYSFDAVRDVDAVIAQFESYETAAKADEALVEYAKDKQPHELTYAEVEQFSKVSRLGEDLEKAMLERYFYSLPAEQRRAVMNSDEWPSQYSHRMAVEEAYGSGLNVPAKVLEELGMTGAPRSAYKRTDTPSPVVAPKPAPKVAEPTPQPKPVTVQPGVFPLSNARPVQKRDHIIALYPNRVGGKFSPADIEAVKEWAQSEQATVVASPTVITVTGPLGKNWAATAMKAVESVRGLTVRQARNKAAVDQYNQRVEAKNAADKAYIAANSDVAEWLANVFGDNFANPHNQAALIRYLVGDAKKFDGGMNPSWVPGLEKLGLNSSNASNLKTNDIAAVIKQAWQAKPQAPAEPKVVAKTPQRLRYNEIIAEYAKSRGASVFDGNSPTGRIAAQDAFKQVQKEFPWVRNFGDLDRQAPDILASPSKPAKSKDTITVDGKERPRTNSNGQPIHPTEEGIRAFWRWFGDSKVVDEQGRPLVVYHGTQADFQAFSDEFFGEGNGNNDWGDGFYFASNPAAANTYADGKGGRIVPVYLSIQNAADIKVMTSRRLSDAMDDGMGFETVQEILDEMGYNGVAIDHGKDGKEYVVFSSTQIKSAIGNQGTFSPDNPSILASPRRVRRGMAPEPIKWEVAALPYDGPTIPLSDLRIDLEQAFGKLRTGTSAKGTKGVYVISPDIKYVRYGNDVVTAAHEIAHQLDARQGITNNIAGPALDQLRSGFFDRTIPENASQEVADMERFAVLVEAYVSDPERLKALTPELFGWMEKILPPKSLTALQNFSTKLRQYAGQSATAKASSSFVMGRQVNPVQRTVENIKAGSMERFTDSLTQGWLDQYGALLRSVDRIIGGGDRKEGARKRKENPLMDWEVALRDVPYTDEMFTAQMQEGFIDRRLSEQTGSVVTAPSFVQLVSHLEPGTDKFEENYRKATAYMNALRHLDWADRKKSEAEANIEAYIDAVNEVKDTAIAQKRLDLMTKAVENGASNIELAIKPELDAYIKRITSIAKGKITRFSNAERKHAIRMGEESGLVAMGPGIKSTVEEARRALKELEPDMKMLRAFEKDYRALSDYNLNMLVWGGRLTPDQAATIRANNPHWFAVIRIDDREATLEEVVRAHLRPTRSIFGARNLVHSFQGSQRTKDDPLAALATRMRDVMQESHRNRALAQMTYLLKNAGFADGMEGELNRVRLEDGIAPTENQFTIWVNGEKQVWEVSKENSAVLQSMRAISMQSEDGKVLEAILNVLSKPASITRNLIINAPPFIVRNLTRDTIHRMTMVENFGPSAKVPKQSGLAKSMGVGLGRSTVFEDPDSFVRRQKDALDDLTSKGHIVLRGRRAYQNLRESAEMVNRKAVFDQAYRAFRASGYNEYQATTLAAYAARESMTDFKKIGSKARALSQIIPFFSAQIAGTSTSMRQLGKNPAQVIKKLTVYSAVLMGLEQLWAAFGGDDEEKELERLNNLDRYQRELFWNFRVGGDDGFWLSIPKGHEQSIYTTMVGQLAASLNEGRFGKPDSNRVPRAFVDNLLPVSTLPDAFGGWLPLVELVFNKKMYNDREIVPDYERNKEMSRRNIQYASPIGKALHGFLGVDARQWDYALEEMTGYYGRAITGMAEAENPDDAGRILLRFTGLNMPGSPTQNENVIAVDNLLRTFGKRPTGWESMKKAFFNAKTEAERQRAGRALVNRAKIVRERLEAWKPLPDEARKANVDLLFP